MRKRYLLILTVAVVLIAMLLVPACTKPAPTPTPTPTPTPKPAEPMIMKLAHPVPQGASVAKGWEWWAAQAEVVTDGRVKIEVYPGGTLYKIEAALDSLIGGVAEFSVISFQSHVQRLPILSVATLPLMGFPENVEGSLAYGDALLDLVEKFPAAQEETKDFKIIFPYGTSNYILVSKNKLIKTPSDFKGMKVGGGGEKMQLVTNAGGAAVSMTPPDMYMNLDKGIVDAVMGSWSHINLHKLYEIAKYYTNIGINQGPLPICANISAWNKISPEDQKAMLDLIPEARRMGTENGMKSIEAGKKAVKDKGDTIHNPTESEYNVWTNAAKPLWDKWVKDMEALGIKNPQQYIDFWNNQKQEAMKKYGG